MKISSLFFIFVFLCGCAHNPQDKFLMGNLYFQKSSEVKALYLQAYNAASDNLIRLKNDKVNQCIILDVDETVLDNSLYQGWLFKEGQNYSSKTWDDWVLTANASVLPGALGFIKKARNMGYKTMFITNRKSYLKNATLNNLNKVGLKVERSDLLLRTNTSSKVERRKVIEKSCRIEMLIGDSMADFSEVFEGAYSERVEKVQELKKQFGRRYFVLPNPMYGDWIRKIKGQSLNSYK